MAERRINSLDIVEINEVLRELHEELDVLRSRSDALEAKDTPSKMELKKYGLYRDKNGPHVAHSEIIAEMGMHIPNLPLSKASALNYDQISGLLKKLQLPVGTVLMLTVSTNPADLVGYGTWVRIAEGQFLVGQKDADADFGTNGATGGAKTHTHTVPATATAAVTAAAGGTNVADQTHTHTTAAASNLPPFKVVYTWERTA